MEWAEILTESREIAKKKNNYELSVSSNPCKLIQTLLNSSYLFKNQAMALILNVCRNHLTASCFLNSGNWLLTNKTYCLHCN